MIRPSRVPRRPRHGAARASPCGSRRRRSRSAAGSEQRRRRPRPRAPPRAARTPRPRRRAGSATRVCSRIAASSCAGSVDELRRVQDAVEVAARRARRRPARRARSSRRPRCSGCCASASRELVEALAGAGEIDADALRALIGYPAPSLSSVLAGRRTERGLFGGVGRRAQLEPPVLAVRHRSTRASATAGRVSASCADELAARADAAAGGRAGAASTSTSRMTTRATSARRRADVSTRCRVSSAPTTSTWSPARSVPASSWFASPATWTARCVPLIWARTPRSAGVPKRRRVTCSPA